MAPPGYPKTQGTSRRSRQAQMISAPERSAGEDLRMGRGSWVTDIYSSPSSSHSERTADRRRQSYDTATGATVQFMFSVDCINAFYGKEEEFSGRLRRICRGRRTRVPVPNLP